MDKRNSAAMRRRQGHLNAAEMAEELGVNKFTFHYWSNHGLVPKPSITFTGKSSDESEKVSNTKSESTDVPDTIRIDKREFKRFRSFFFSHQEASEAGYYPQSFWEKRGRVVVETAKPTLVVAKSWRTFHPAEEDVILAYSLTNEYLVSVPKYFPEVKSRGCWAVYRQDETHPKQAAANSRAPQKQERKRKHKTERKIEKETQITSSPPLTTSPYDVENITNNDPKGRRDKELGTPVIQTRLTARLTRAGKKCEVYFPEGFDWDAYPLLAPHRSSVMWLAHKIYERRFLNAEGVEYGKDAYISINSQIARAIDPKFTTVVKLLLTLDILERLPYSNSRPARKP